LAKAYYSELAMFLKFSELFKCSMASTMKVALASPLLVSIDSNSESTNFMKVALLEVIGSKHL